MGMQRSGRRVHGGWAVALIVVASFAMTFAPAWAFQATPTASPYVPRQDLATLEGTITADGSSTVYPITDEAGLLFHELADGVRVEADFSGTGGGFLAFCAGETDI